MFLRRHWSLILAIALAACVHAIPDISPQGTDGGSLNTNLPTVFVPTPTMTPSFHLLPTRIPGSPILTPTPDSPHISSVKDPSGPESYIVQYGDTLSTIAERYGVKWEALMAANNLADPNALVVGQTLTIPRPTPQAVGPTFKIIPDSELIYGPMSINLDIDAFVHNRGGYLASYSEDVAFETLTGGQIVERVAQNDSVNPRLLLALLEYCSGWVTNTNPNPDTLSEPLGIRDGLHPGLYRQLTWAADRLNRGYYLWRIGGLTQWTLADDSIVPAAPTINAGTAGVQSFFEGLDDYPTWLRDVSQDGLFKTYTALFGYPFDLTIEPIVPENLIQPLMHLPFGPGEIWAFTGGPHEGWNPNSAWAALDFAPPGGAQGCVESDAWVTAVADGLILRAKNGAVVQDLDGDGYEQTGWTILYMHIESRDRVTPGEYIRQGERIGHPSCEGGVSNGTHIHLARRFNGEWIPADGAVPFNLDGWVSSGSGIEYDGTLKRNGITVEAFDGISPSNQIQR